MLHVLKYMVLISCSAVAINTSHAADITRGTMLSNSCAACHGTDGKSPGEIPSINGKSFEFISQALHDFREGKRKATVMGRHASGYSDDEITAIAEFFSGQP